MGLLKHQLIDADGELGVWKLEESAEWYLDRLDLHDEETLQLETLRNDKRLEWLAARWLLHEMSGREVRGKVLKDAFGKPYLEDSKWTISLSHSNQRAAVLASSRSGGVDVQLIEQRISKLAVRFMSEEELKVVNVDNEIEKVHVYWGAKEALFKLYAEGNVDFRQNLYIRPFNYDESGTVSAKIMMPDMKLECKIFYEKLDNYILVWTIAPF